MVFGPLKILNLNVNMGLDLKYLDLMDLLYARKIDLGLIQETGDFDEKLCFFRHPDYRTFSFPRLRNKGGGVCAVVHRALVDTVEIWKVDNAVSEIVVLRLRLLLRV